VQDVVVRKADDAVLLLLIQPACPLLVVLDLLGMSVAVNLDDEFGFGAKEM